MPKIILEFDDDGYYIGSNTEEFTFKKTSADYYKVFYKDECIGFLWNDHRHTCYDKENKLVCKNAHIQYQFFPKVENRIELRKGKKHVSD